MRAFFSVAAYKNYDKVAAICSKAEEIVNNILRKKTYGCLKFLTAQFSFLTLVEVQDPKIEYDNTLSFVVPVYTDHDEPTDIIQALLSNLDTPIVPPELKHDLEEAFRNEGWLS